MFHFHVSFIKQFRVELNFEKMYSSTFQMLVYLTFSVKIHSFKSILPFTTKFQQGPFSGL